MAQDSTGRRPPRMLWLALACALAVAVCGCLLVADLLGQILALWQERPPSVRWLNVGAAGQGVLGAAAICVLVAGGRRPGWRRGALLAEVLIVVVAFGWFFLTAWLQRRALPARHGSRARGVCPLAIARPMRPSRTSGLSSTGNRRAG